MNFDFKQFSITQENTAMKVGTDGVLLGVWTHLEHAPFSILDIGTGTGVIALMLAQRCDAEQIDALEIDEGAFEDAVVNFENSPWNDRLFCYHASLDDFMDNLEEEEYDLIVSNPPFYVDAYASGDKKRDSARLESALPFSDLIEAVSVLLSVEGIFCTIIPYKEEEKFLSLAFANDLYPVRVTHVKGRPESEIKRSLLAFSKSRAEKVAVTELVIETARHRYTDDYIGLTKDFYLKF